MITSFRSKALKRLWTELDTRALNPLHLSRVKRILNALDNADVAEDMAIPGLRLHKLHGDLPPRWSVWVSGNWRITFSMVNGEARDVDYEDYH
jgi:toxin HigB-1